MRGSFVSCKLIKSREAFSARLALDRFVFLVQALVISQAARVRELFGADGAGVALNAVVRAVHVLLHVVQTRERLAADGADVAAGVQSPVVGVLAPRAHFLAAQFALVRFLAGVHALVLSKIAGCDESLATGVALVRPLAGVQTSMFRSGVAAAEGFAADVADVRLFTGVRPVMVGIF